KGRSAPRQPSEISFHSLRHSTATFLRAAGVSDFVAREILGHESAAIARLYTHLTTDDLRAAMQRVPDVRANPTTDEVLERLRTEKIVKIEPMADYLKRRQAEETV